MTVALKKFKKFYGALKPLWSWKMLNILLKLWIRIIESLLYEDISVQLKAKELNINFITLVPFKLS